MTLLPEIKLADHFLIAMPDIDDPIFEGAVVYICEHNEDGALGVVINKPTDMTLEILLKRIDLSHSHSLASSNAIMFGGPVQDNRGFVLHTPIDTYSSSLKITDQLAFTTSRDVLEDVAIGQGPKNMLVSVGYAGWRPGQIENEIAHNGWLTVKADPKVIFELPAEDRYMAAMGLLGFEPLSLIPKAGHA